MPRPHRSGALFCMAVVVLAATLPGFSAFDCALVDPQWVLLPDPVTIAVVAAVDSRAEQPHSLLSLLPSRAPPIASA